MLHSVIMLVLYPNAYAFILTRSRAILAHEVLAKCYFITQGTEQSMAKNFVYLSELNEAYKGLNFLLNTLPKVFYMRIATYCLYTATVVFVILQKRTYFDQKT